MKQIVTQKEIYQAVGEWLQRKHNFGPRIKMQLVVDNVGGGEGSFSVEVEDCTDKKIAGR